MRNVQHSWGFTQLRPGDNHTWCSLVSSYSDNQTCMRRELTTILIGGVSAPTMTMTASAVPGAMPEILGLPNLQIL
jgi:hypothetical protein